MCVVPLCAADLNYLIVLFAGDTCYCCPKLCRLFAYTCWRFCAARLSMRELCFAVALTASDAALGYLGPFFCLRALSPQHVFFVQLALFVFCSCAAWSGAAKKIPLVLCHAQVGRAHRPTLRGPWHTRVTRKGLPLLQRGGTCGN